MCDLYGFQAKKNTGAAEFHLNAFRVINPQ